MSYSRLSKADPCLRCGAAPLTDDARFCTKCGATLTHSVYYTDLPKPVEVNQPLDRRLRELTARRPSFAPSRRVTVVLRLRNARWIDAAVALITRHAPALTDDPATSWKIEYRGGFAIEDNDSSSARYLIVNRAEVVTEGCSACGQAFASAAPGNRALGVSLGPENGTYLFCSSCGDWIMEHLQTDAVPESYAWDWTVPLRGKPLKNQDAN